MSTYLLIPHIKVIGANAFNGMFSIGMPAMTAWLGSVHALQRNVSTTEGLEDVRFNKTAVSIHDFKSRTFRRLDGVLVTIDKKHSCKHSGSSLKTAPFVEEPMCDFNASLLIEVSNLAIKNEDLLRKTICDKLNKLRIAGGDIVSFKDVKLIGVNPKEPSSVKKALCTLMPGNVLIETDILKEAEDPLERLISVLKVHKVRKDSSSPYVAQKRKVPGWLVPIAVGYKSISGYVDKDKALNARNRNYKTRYVESAIALCEFKMPYLFDSIDDIMWHYEVDKDKGLYLCKNN